MKRPESRFRRLISVATAGVLALGLLGACGRSDGGKQQDGGSGIGTTAGFDGSTISVGLVTVTSGPLAPAMKPYIAAQQAWLTQINSKGGIAGKYKVKFELTDSAYNPAQAIQQYEQTKGKVVMFADIFGTPIVQSILPRLKADKIFASAGTADGSLFREENIILKFTPYESQLLEGLDYYLQHGKEGKDATFCGIGLEGPLYESVQRAMDFAKKRLSIKTGPIVAVPLTATDATPQVLQLQSGQCDVVLVQAVAAALNVFAASAAKVGFAPQYIATSTSWIPVEQSNPLFEYYQKNLLQTADSVPYGYKDASGMADLTKAHDTSSPDIAPTVAYVQSWVGMLAIQDILERAVQRKDLSHAGILEASNSMTSIDLRGVGPKWPWGPPDKRTAPEQYSIYEPDSSNPAGTKAVAVNLAAPKVAVEYPY